MLSWSRYLSAWGPPSTSASTRVQRVRSIIKPILEILAGIPTVVFGFFALFFINPELVRRVWPGDVGTYSGLAAGLVVGVMILPTVASLAEDAMSAVPQGLRQGAFALGSTRREVSTSVVFRAALSGIVASIVLAASRAIGETTIVLIAAGSRPTMTTDPGEQMQSMASFIGFAGIGDLPTGSTEYKTIFAVGALLFVDHTRPQRHQHPHRAAVQGGLRMSAVIEAPEAAVTLDVAATGSRRLKDVLFKGLLITSLGLALGVLLTLIADLVLEGRPRLNWDLVTSMPSARPARAGIYSAIFGSLWVVGLTAAISLPLGIGAALYLEEFAHKDRWYNRLIELNIQNLAGVPSIVYGILGLAFVARGSLGWGFTVRTAALILSDGGAADGGDRIQRGDSSGAGLAPQGGLALGATQWQTVYRQVLPAAVPGIATGSILATSRALGESAPLLMVGALTFVTFTPDGFDSAYTVLPLQIFGYISEARPEFKPLAAAAAIVLLAILVLMNSVAILLRNKFQKKW